MSVFQRGGGESFLAGHGSSFPQQDVMVVHNAGTPEEVRTLVRAHLQSRKGYFDIDAPVYEGDEIRLDDPRGGERVLTVKSVDLHDVRGTAGFEGMSHIEVAF